MLDGVKGGSEIEEDSVCVGFATEIGEYSVDDETDAGFGTATR